MKKIIDIPNEILQELKILAVKSNKDIKNFIQDGFILEALQISEDKRKLPLKTQCPNGLEVYPSIKMKFKNFGSSLLGDKLVAMNITWRD